MRQVGAYVEKMVRADIGILQTDMIHVMLNVIKAGADRSFFEMCSPCAETTINLSRFGFDFAPGVEQMAKFGRSWV